MMALAVFKIIQAHGKERQSETDSIGQPALWGLPGGLPSTAT